MKILRTPDEQFVGIGFDFEPRFVNLTSHGDPELRMHYIDEGPSAGEVIFCLHGQPSWSYLYRKMVASLTGAGYRVIACDLIGFGKSDKPTEVEDYTYARHVDWVSELIDHLGLADINAFFQDWGGLIGMRVVERARERFKRVMVANTMLLGSSDVSPEASAALEAAYPGIPLPSAETVTEKFTAGDPLAIAYWVKYATENPDFSVPDVFSKITGLTDPDALKGYAAPFPDRTYMAGPRAFPSLLPIMPWHRAERAENDRVWRSLADFDRPVLTAFSDGDPLTRGHEMKFQTRIAGAKAVEHVTIAGGGHYLQDDSAEPLCEAVLKFLSATS